MNITTKQKLAELLIERLNEITNKAPIAMDWLLSNRIICAELLEHPTVQVDVSTKGNLMIGMLGIINGLVGTIDEGPNKGKGLITVVWDDDEVIHRFIRTPSR